MAKKAPLKDLKELSTEELEAQRQAELDAGNPPEVELDESTVQIDEILRSNELEGGTIRLHRRGPTDNQFNYLCKIKASEFDIEFIKKVYGGGDYQGKTYRANGQMYRPIEFSIDPRFPGTIEVPKGGQVAGGQASTDPVALMRVMHEMGKDDKGSAAIMQRLMESQSQSSRDMLVMMQQSSDKQMQMMMAMMTAAFSRPEPRNDNLTTKDILTLLPTLIPVFKGEKPQSTLLETIEAMKGMRELVSTGQVSEAPEAPKTLVEQIIGALPHVATTVQALRGGQPVLQPQPQKPVVSAQPTLAATKPAPIAGEAPVAANPAASPAVAVELDSRQQLLVTLVNAARKNRDVELYADLVNSELEDVDVPMFHQLLTSEGWFDSLFGTLPDKESIRPWFDRLRELLIETFNSETPSPNGSPEPVDPAAATPSGANPTGVQSGRDAGGAAKNS